MVTEINSEDRIPVDCHFKVTAGPGAGKTHWLINHIKNVLAHSDRLGKCGKIACITYTNVGVDTIVRRLGLTTKGVEVCTIHSFFYNNIVKPYLWLIADDEGFNLDLLKGEDDRFDLSYSTLEAIKKESNQRYATDALLKLAIRNARWRIDEHGEIVCKPKHAMKANARGTFLSSKTYLAYKKQAWAKGLMHYDDVIYFAYRLFERIPFIPEVIARRFPFLFIDEFQDSHPIQVGLIKKLSECGSIIGVIGDPAQSIYQFLGADVTQFNTFTLPHLQEYVISGNRRSTIKIVDFLNSIRGDLEQVPHRVVQGEVPVLLVGSHIDNYQKVQEIIGIDVYALSYDNLNANSLKKMMNANAQDKHLIDNIIDSNEERKTVVATYIKALEHAKAKNFKKTFDLLARLDVDIKDAVVKIHSLLSSYDDISKMSLYEFYAYLNITFGLSMATLKKGQAQTFYNSHQYSQLAMCVNHEDDDGIQRTIHKAKGDEFDNVMVCLGDEKALDFFLQPDLLNNESHRVYYVAASRAKERLFFSIPSLSNYNRKKIEKLGIEIKQI